jgi:D-glycero-D-manno-heptose 1,7-bisphosphate phosphatase
VRARRTGNRLSAVFLDRDGVVNRKAPEGDYVTSWERFEFLPGALEGLRLLAEAGAPS